MKRICVIAAVVAGFAWPCASGAEILALVNYESKPADALKAFKSPVPGHTRQEGLAVIDVDSSSPNFKNAAAMTYAPSCPRSPATSDLKPAPSATIGDSPLANSARTTTSK